MTPVVEIKVMSSAAFKPAYLELVPQFERASGHKVTTSWVLTVDMLTRLKGGEIVDLVIMAGNSIDELIKLGKLAPGSRVDLARCGIGVAVRAGTSRPDISSIQNFRHALLQAKSIAYSTGPSGVYLSGLFQRLDIADELKSKITQIKGDSIGAVIARGEAEIGFQQVSELLPVTGIDYLGPLPAEIQEVTVFSAGLHAGAKEPDAATALVKFLTAPEAVAIIKQTGMEPG
jgi:molybdate transport system substrate-binding protein